MGVNKKEYLIRLGVPEHFIDELIEQIDRWNVKPSGIRVITHPENVSFKDIHKNKH